MFLSNKSLLYNNFQLCYKLCFNFLVIWEDNHSCNFEANSDSWYWQFSWKEKGNITTSTSLPQIVSLWQIQKFMLTEKTTCIWSKKTRAMNTTYLGTNLHCAKEMTVRKPRWHSTSSIITSTAPNHPTHLPYTKLMVIC